MTKILVVDDENLLCELYAEEFSREGYEVISTSDCERLMEIIEEHGPDIIVLDIRMGEWSGLDLLQDIRNTYYSMPVILCSAYSSFKHDMKSVAADYYVVKSGDLTELKTRINMALGDRGKRWTISLKNSLKVSRGLADQENGGNSVNRSF